MFAWSRRFLLSVVNAVLGMILANILKVLFRLYNLVVALVLQFVVGLPKEKVSLPPVGDRPVLKQSALEIADQVMLIIMQTLFSLLHLCVANSGNK